jgi:hypothetical protein
MEGKKTCTYKADQKNKTIKVPIGRYVISYAEFRSDNPRDKIVAFGNYKRNVTFGAGKEHQYKWGLPLKFNIKVSKSGKKYTIARENVTVCGIGGAEYRYMSLKSLFKKPPWVEWYMGGKREIKRQYSGYLSVETNKTGMYVIKMYGESSLFGKVEGEVKR